MHMNARTSTALERVRDSPVPVTDKAANQAAVGTYWRFNGETAKLRITRSTLHLEDILISPTTAEDLGDAGGVAPDAMPIAFNDAAV